MGDNEFRFVFGEPPEEIKEQIQAEIDRQQMVTQSMQHDISRLFSEMDADSLGTMRFLLHVLAQNPVAAAFYEGVCATYLTLKHGVCSCGHNHDEDLEKLSEQPADEVRVIQREGGLEEIQEFNKDLEAEIVAQLEEYSLNAMGDGTVSCKNCGFVSVSLADRVLRPPGVAGCPGCVDKQKWG